MSSLFLFLILFGTGAVQPNSNGGTNIRTTYCVLPPQPKNGRYVILEPEREGLAPGDQLGNFSLDLSCDPGYHLTGSVIHLCLDGEYFLSMSECLRHCNRVQLSVFSCGSGVQDEDARCVMPDDFYPTLSRNNPPPNELNCGSTGPEYVNIISGGRRATKQELPWHAGIYSKKTRPYMQICGGSLIKENVVISAAHCFWSDIDKQRPVSEYAVAVGKLYRPWNEPNDENAQKSDVAEIRIPPRFQGSAANLQDDIALVIVTSPFTFTSSVTPVCLDFDVTFDAKQLTAGKLGKVAGWGLTGENSKASPVLKVVELPVVGIQDCIDKSDPSFSAHITSDKICAGYQNGTAVCKGDSGGGLSFPEAMDGVKRYFLRGIVSASPQNQNLCNTLSWATFTHVLNHEHFIREIVPKAVP